MKKWFLILITISPIFSFHSHMKLKKYNNDSKILLKLKIYHDNGNIYQKGFLKIINFMVYCNHMTLMGI